MRRLSVSQAARCEQATGPKCKCRCGGAQHGASRQAEQQGVTLEQFLMALPEDDPHKIAIKEAKKQR
jgi:hypothetical protein